MKNKGKGRPWTEEEDDVIREEYPMGDTWLLAKQLVRTRDAVIKRAYVLGVRKKEKQQTRVYNSIIRRQRKAGFLVI